jgi:hypothetical protein
MKRRFALLLLFTLLSGTGCLAPLNSNGGLYDNTYSKTMACHSGGAKVNCW